MTDKIEANRSQWIEISVQANRLLQIVLASTPIKNFEVSPSTLRVVVSMYWRARRLYEATLILLKSEMAEESMFLARSLFEESLRLQQLATEARDRDALILGWVNRSIDEKRGLLRVGIACGIDNDINTALASLDDEEKKLQEFGRKNSSLPLKTFVQVKDAAFRFNRKDDYWTYEWAHEQVHGSDAAWMFSRKQLGEAVAFLAKTPDPSLFSSVAHFAAKSMTDAVSAAFNILGWTLPSELEQPVKEIERLLDSKTGT